MDNSKTTTVGSRPKRGFTLVELLVVIAIIAVLASLAAPAIMNSLKKAKVTKVSAMCSALETSINNFESEYNYLPFGSGSSPTSDDSVRTDDDVIAVLCGVEDEVNFKEIKFFEYSSANGDSPSNYSDGLHVDATAGTAGLYDTWGQPLYLRIDYDQDGEITADTGNSKIDDKPVTGRKAIIHSSGPDGRDKNIDNDTDLKDIPRNW